MATLQRGYSFAATEVVNETKLNQLITNAQLSAISWSEFNGDVIGISIFSALSNVSAGWIQAVYEPNRMTGSSYSDMFKEFTYLITTPNGLLALFKNGGYETNRFVAAHGGSSQYFIQGGGYHVATPNAAVTLTVNLESGSAAFGNAHVVGSNSAGTADTSPTSSTAVPRITLRGYCVVRDDSAQLNASDINPRWIIQGNKVDGAFMATAGSAMDKIFGLELVNGGYDGLRGSWLWGSPIWRT